jgi:hypothetical protein
MGFPVEAPADTSDVPLPRRDARGALQWQHRAENAGRHSVRQEGCELGLEILKLRTRVAAQPDSERADALPAARLAATAIESRRI